MTSAKGRLGRFYLVGFLVLMVFDALAQMCVKLAGAGALPLELTAGWLMRLLVQPWLYGAGIGYLGAFFTWMTLLEHAPIGPAFAASHLEIIIVLLLSHYLLGEHIGAAQIVGAALILGGIFCLACGESRAMQSLDP